MVYYFIKNINRIFFYFLNLKLKSLKYKILYIKIHKKIREICNLELNISLEAIKKHPICNLPSKG